MFLDKHPTEVYMATLIFFFNEPVMLGWGCRGDEVGIK